MERNESRGCYILSPDEQRLLYLDSSGLLNSSSEFWPISSGVHLLELAELRLVNVLDVDTSAPQQSIRESMKTYKERQTAVLQGIIDIVATDISKALAIEAEAFLMQSENE